MAKVTELGSGGDRSGGESPHFSTDQLSQKGEITWAWKEEGGHLGKIRLVSKTFKDS